MEEPTPPVKGLLSIDGYGCEKLHVGKFEAKISTDNIQSLAMFSKLGFQERRLTLNGQRGLKSFIIDGGSCKPSVTWSLAPSTLCVYQRECELTLQRRASPTLDPELVRLNLEDVNPHWYEGRVENNLRKTTLISLNRDLNLDLPILCDLAQHETITLDNYATEAVGEVTHCIVNWFIFEARTSAFRTCFGTLQSFVLASTFAMTELHDRSWIWRNVYEMRNIGTSISQASSPICEIQVVCSTPFLHMVVHNIVFNELTLQREVDHGWKQWLCTETSSSVTLTTDS
uniref:Uncharacterized protein n=1 Tax=Timema monikensis TaxID=170555 RepID=A0A7R9EC29_9NEOP|nr:unnamed protein product [Timema monikensis]